MVSSIQAENSPYRDSCHDGKGGPGFAGVRTIFTSGAGWTGEFRIGAYVQESHLRGGERKAMSSRSVEMNGGERPDGPITARARRIGDVAAHCPAVLDG